MSDDDSVIVCDACFTASCWQGIFYCDQYRTAGITDKTVGELRKLGREHPNFWRDFRGMYGETSRERTNFRR